jgi:hypothetical protein
MVAGRLKPSRGAKTGVKKEEDNHAKRSSYVLRLNRRSVNIVFRIGAAQEL